MAITPVYHPASVNIPLLFPLYYPQKFYIHTIWNFYATQNLPNNHYLVCSETQIWPQSAVSLSCTCILIEWGRASPSSVYLLFFWVFLPRQGKWFSRLCRFRGFVVSLVNIMTMHFLFSRSSGNPCLVPHCQSSRQTSSCPLVGILILWRSHWW